MKKNFMDYARELICTYPGKTSSEYAAMALEIDPGLSNAVKVTPEFSLSTTLDKQVRDGMEKGIRREKINGEFHYFPK